VRLARINAEVLDDISCGEEEMRSRVNATVPAAAGAGVRIGEKPIASVTTEDVETIRDSLHFHD
jgi:hypothetical protein